MLQWKRGFENNSTLGGYSSEKCFNAKKILRCLVLLQSDHNLLPIYTPASCILSAAKVVGKENISLKPPPTLTGDTYLNQFIFLVVQIYILSNWCSGLIEDKMEKI